jgi:hypothetical protein
MATTASPDPNDGGRRTTILTEPRRLVPRPREREALAAYVDAGGYAPASWARWPQEVIDLVAAVAAPPS